MTRFNTFLLLWISFFFGTFSNLKAQNEWHVSYEEAISAISREQWRTALEALNSAIAAKSEPKSNARTYGMNFVDYLPYLYRGMVHYHLGEYEKARIDLQRSRNSGEVNKARRDKNAGQNLQTYLNLIAQHDERQKTERLFTQGVRLFDSGNLDAAKQKFEQVAALDPNHAGAGNYLERVEDRLKAEATKPDISASDRNISEQPARNREPENNARRNDIKKPPVQNPPPEKNVADRVEQRQIEKLRSEAVAYFERGDLEAAHTAFSNLLELDPTNREGKAYLSRIDKVEELLRKGVAAYFNGENENSIDRLKRLTSEYQASAAGYFFLGSSYLSQYFLGGETEETLAEKAKQAFGQVKKLSPNYQPDETYISPKIVTFFKQI